MPTISVTVHDEHDDVDRLTRQLLQEVNALDVTDTRLGSSAQEPPAGSKSPDPALVSTIVVAVSSSPVLVQLGHLLRDWVNRGRHRKLVVRDGDRYLELTGGTVEEHERAVSAFFDTRDEGPDRIER